MRTKLHLPKDRVDYARQLAKKIASPVAEFIDRHSSVTVERSTLRLAGADGANADGVPVPNLVVDQIRAADPALLEDGALLRYVNALAKDGGTVEALNRKIADGFNVMSVPLGDRAAIEAKAAELVDRATSRIKDNRAHRDRKLEEFRDRNGKPLLYLIVATGNIYEDVKQAQAAATAQEWAAFARKYRAEMATPENRHTLALLARMSQDANFSVGCYCEDESHCHRSVLRELLAEAGAQITP